MCVIQELTMLPLKLKKPLAIFDIESTGLNPRLDRIIDLAIIKIYPDGEIERHIFRVNPEITISAEVTAIHHISNADVTNSPAFREVAPRVLEILNGCDLGGFGVVRFDIPLLIEEFARAGVPFDDADFRVIDVQRIYHKNEPRDLSAALLFYCEETYLKAHGAEEDALATVRVLEAQLRKYSDLPGTIDGLDEYCHPRRDPTWVDKTGKLKWKNAEIVINFGVQNRGQKLRDLVQNNAKFLKWLLKSDFPSDTKKIVSNAMEGKFPESPKSCI